MAKVFIYALIDPDTKQVRYIGKTINPKDRPSQHIRDPKRTYKRNWLMTVLKRGKKPEFTILEEVDEREWQIAEKRWISLYRPQGNLTNMTEGGLGGGSGKRNLTEEGRERLRQSSRSRMLKLISEQEAEKRKLESMSEKQRVKYRQDKKLRESRKTP
jgi:hypothetical protein